jgi:hypothetical protein
MKEKCKYCKKEIEIKGKLSMNGHITNCSSFKKWRDTTFNYDMLYTEYVINGKSALQIANESGWNSSTIINKQLKRVGIEVRNVKQSHKMNLYKERIESTNIERYGAVNPLSKGTIAFEKRNNTVKQKYGVDNIFQAEHIKDIIRKTDAYKELFPNYNRKSIPIIEQYGKEHGYTFQHAENGGEYYVDGLGFYLDGYDTDKNVAIEIDEPFHFTKNGKLREKDIIRQQKIENKIGCKFVRIKYED